jgi:hypothetical protein
MALNRRWNRFWTGTHFAGMNLIWFAFVTRDVDLIMDYSILTGSVF